MQLNALLLGLAIVGCAARPADEHKALQALQAFCQLEFNGIRDARYTHATLTDPMPGGYADGHVLDPDASPMRIVRTMKLEGVRVEGSTAEGWVRFEQLGETLGAGSKTRRIRQSVRSERIAYSLRLTEAGWRVLDPPLPRVSMVATRDFLLESLEFMQRLSQRHPLGESQREYIESLTRQLQQLETL